MMDLAEAILQTLLERGTMTWYRLDPVIAAQGFLMGPRFAHAIRQLKDQGLLTESPAPQGPPLLTLTQAGQTMAQYLDMQAAEHEACLAGKQPAPRASVLWEQLAQQATQHDRSDPGLGPREAM